MQYCVQTVTSVLIKVDHTAAIKEYSRSSADQEEPLPHELRPLPVLSMTMDYLVIQIMDQVQDNYRDWYDFVWNRTRGIRKVTTTTQNNILQRYGALIEIFFSSSSVIISGHHSAAPVLPTNRFTD